MACRAKTRERVRSVAERLEADPRVETVNMIHRHESPTGRWTLDIVCARDCAAIPAEVLTTLGGHGFGLQETTTQGMQPTAVAVLG